MILRPKPIAAYHAALAAIAECASMSAIGERYRGSTGQATIGPMLSMKKSVLAVVAARSPVGGAISFPWD